MGTVFLARARDGTLVAAKIVHPQLANDGHFRARFRAEAQLAARVASFSTAPVLDYGDADGRPYLITEYIEGVPLDRMVRQRGALSTSAVQAVAVGIAAALSSIHNAGLVHRDLKPPNVILSLSGTRVIDFGIARALDAPSTLTRSGITMGSPGWMAPEQILGEPLTSAADIFAWGCLVTYAATGRHPYGSGSPVTMAYRTLHHEPNLEDVPDQLYPSVVAALRRNPSRRPTAAQLLTRLSGSTAADGTASGAERDSSTRQAAVLTPLHHFPVRHRARSRRGWWLVTGAAMISVVTAVSVASSYSDGVGDAPPRPSPPAHAPVHEPATDPSDPGNSGAGEPRNEPEHSTSPTAPPSDGIGHQPPQPSGSPSPTGQPPTDTPTASPSEALPIPTPTQPGRR